MANVITTENLQQYHEGIKDKFLTEAKASGIYAKLAGDSGNDFSAKTVTSEAVVVGSSPQAVISAGSDSNDNVFLTVVCNGHVAQIPVNAGNILGADSLLTQYSTLKYPSLNVFSGAYTAAKEADLAGWDIANGSIVFYGGEYSGKGFTGKGFYKVAVSKGVQQASVVTSAEFVQAASPYELYYDRKNDRLCWYDGSSMKTIATGTTTVVDGDTEYTPASADEIARIIDGTYETSTQNG